MTAPDPRVGEIEDRLSAATPGPWRPVEGGSAPYVDAPSGDIAANVYLTDDAEFIAHAPSDVAYLLAELRKAHEALTRVEELADNAPKMQHMGGWSPGIVLASDLRAAVAAANGDGNG